MTLSNAFDAARSALNQNSARSTLISRNIAGASNPDYTRKTISINSNSFGTASIDAISRAADRVLLATTLDSTSAASAADVRSNALNQLDVNASDPNNANGLPSLITGLQTAIQTAAADPSNAVSLNAITTAASKLATTLNSSSANVDQQRAYADQTIASGVATINTLLSQFDTVNQQIKAAAGSNADVTGAMDSRDGIVKQIAQQVGVTMVIQPDGGASLYTDGGATLYDRGVRQVTFTPTSVFGPGSTGQAVMVDGIPITGAGSPMTSKTGAIAGLADFRDNLAPQYQSQLDGVARGLIEAFAETDQSATPTLPNAPGLFSWSGAPSIPGQPTQPGIAGSIKLNPSVDPTQAGSSLLLRDGGINGAGYVANASNYASFSANLQGMLTSLTAPRGFDVTTGAAAGSQNVGAFAASSSGWLASARQSATATATYQDSLKTQATTALSNVTGVNIDDEMSRMLEVENSYQTSARLLTTIDSMFTALFQATVPTA